MDARADLDLSVCIITLNEEARLKRCLESLPPGCEVIVLDSGSSDRTQAIAKSFGARVFERAFDDYGSQKNAALTHATKTWIFSLDADEQMSPALSEALRIALPRIADSYFSVERRLVFMGREMRYGKTTDAPLRLAPRNKVQFSGKIHEMLTPTGEALQHRHFPGGYLLHHSYEDLSDYFEKFNRYTSQIALKKKREGRWEGSAIQVALRPWWEFFNRYLLRLGFLDGYPGYCYALISSLYGFVKYAKYRELMEAGVKKQP